MSFVNLRSEDVFTSSKTALENDMADLFASEPEQPAQPGVSASAPLADRLRPRSLGEVVGQDHLTGPDGAIGRMVAAGKLAPMILWGPPGTGKTTIARLLADAVGIDRNRTRLNSSH